MTAHTAPTYEAAPPADNPLTRPWLQIRWNWLSLWALLAAFAAFEVIKHGFVNGSPLFALALTGTSVAFFIAPDLTFIIGIGDEVPQGSLSRRAVPFYNALHRMPVAVTFTTVIGVGLAPLAPLPLALFIGGLSWIAHIAMDRTAGYGLRNSDGSRELQ